MTCISCGAQQQRVVLDDIEHQGVDGDRALNADPARDHVGPRARARLLVTHHPVADGVVEESMVVAQLPDPLATDQTDLDQLVIQIGTVVDEASAMVKSTKKARNDARGTPCHSMSASVSTIGTSRRRVASRR